MFHPRPQIGDQSWEVATMPSRSVVPTAQRKARNPAVILLGLALYAVGLTAVLPWRSHPPDEVAVVIAAPVISTLVAVTILVYALDTWLVFMVIRLHMKQRSHKLQAQLQFTAFREGILNSVPFATISFAFLLTTGAYAVTDIEWALPLMKFITLVSLVWTGLAFIYGWARGVSDRAAQRMASGAIFLRYHGALTLLQSVGIATGRTGIDTLGRSE